MSLPSGIESSEELLDAQAHIWKHIGHVTTSQSLRCAIQLGIPDIIHRHGKPMPLSELATTLSTHDSKLPHLQRFMRLLVHSGFLAAEGVGYWLTPVSRLLLRDESSSLAQFVVSMLDPSLNDAWGHMREWLEGDLPAPFEVAHGVSLWEATRGEERMNRAINEGMASDSGLVASVIVRDYPEVFAGLGSMVDVGGGSGAAAAVVARAFPALKCRVLDLPHVVSGLKGARNLEFVGGDMFKAIPSADAVFLKWVLHDWSDDECVKILKKCREAIDRERGKVIIVEMVVEEKGRSEEATQTQLAWDVQMMMLSSGRERSLREWENMISAANFTTFKITPLLGLRSVIEIFP